jgi:hypothetical protein
MGTNTDEGRVFAAAAGLTNGTATIQEVVSLLITDNRDVQDAVVAFYAPFFTDVYLFSAAVITDLASVDYVCATYNLILSVLGF